MSIKYAVTTENFAEKYYLKNFRKKYKKSFDVPWSAFVFMLHKFDLMLERNSVSQISDPNREIVIYKVEFKIMPNESAKSSGNRCIIAQDKEKKEIKILLVYCKNNIQNSNETLWWKNLIKKNYSIYKDVL
jgi:hypothetical protein